jgi:multidrug transporter EmrE-like cation transporter
MNYLLFIVQALISAAGVLLLRANLDGSQLKNLLVSTKGTAPLFLGVILYGLSFALWLVILSKINVSIAYPFTIGLTLAFTLVGAHIFLRESLSPQGVLGVAMIIIGVILGGSKAL